MKICINALLICFVLLLGCKKEGPFDWESNNDISVMSFNLRYDTEEDGENKWDNRKEACLKLLNETQPSIIGIQEGLVNQVNYLEDHLPQYDFVGVGRDDGEFSGEYAAIYYLVDDFELVESSSFWLSETPETPSLGWDANNIRIVTWAHLKDIEHDKSVFVFNTHFDHKGKTAREESAKLLVAKINEITDTDASVFITGDFNALIGNSIFDPILAEFKDARKLADHSDNKKSYNGWGKWYLNRNIDFIFYQNANALAFRTLKEDYGVPYISDHYPMISYFDY